ncbi:MAG: hypothetical protein NTY90_04060 [Candidatus Micrarchaeota archaeon]|nr:hypothetical protein [Candidatus Micrarchaeota archaeon]
MPFETIYQLDPRKIGKIRHLGGSLMVTAEPGKGKRPLILIRHLPTNDISVLGVHRDEIVGEGRPGKTLDEKVFGPSTDQRVPAIPFRMARQSERFDEILKERGIKAVALRERDALWNLLVNKKAVVQPGMPPERRKKPLEEYDTLLNRLVKMGKKPVVRKRR